MERVLGLSPTSPDTDNDTLRDRVELWMGLDPRDADSNHDGLPDNAELGRGGLSRTLDNVGGTQSVAVAVNGTGVVVGQRRSETGTWQGFLWSQGNVTWLPGGVASVADINGTSQVVGKTADGRAFRWTATDGLTVLTPDYPDADAAALNDAGAIVGSGAVAENALPTAWRWAGGTLTQLGTLGGPISSAADINSAGRIVGTSTTAGGATHAFMWAGGVMTDLGTLGGGTSQATAINDSGQIVGQSETAAGDFHAFLWDDGVMTDLGTLAGEFSSATAINSAGQIVGTGDAPGGESHALLWDLDGITDLGTLGGTISGATAINDGGVIVGTSDTSMRTDAAPTGTPRAAIMGPAAVDREHPSAAVQNALSRSDNDADGVPDQVDNSPSTKLGATDSVSVDVTTSGRPTYLDFQVVPEDPAHLSLSMAELDWLDGDDQGSMQDRDNSQQDVVLQPYLELDVEDVRGINQAAAPTYMAPRFIDDFERTQLVDQGHAWAALGSWSVQGGQATGQSFSLPGPAWLISDAGVAVADGYVQARVEPLDPVAGHPVGLVFRWRPDGSSYQYVTVSPARLEVHSVIDSMDTLVEAYDVAWSWDSTLRVEYVGRTIRVYRTADPGVDANWTYLAGVDAPAADPDGVRAGLYLPTAGASQGARWDDFETGVLTSDLERYGIVTPETDDTRADDAVGASLEDYDRDGQVDDLSLTWKQPVGFGGATEVVAGGAHSCARTRDDGLWCWGDNWKGQLGTGAPGAWKTELADGTVVSYPYDAWWPDWAERWPNGMLGPAVEPFPVGPGDDLMGSVQGMAAGSEHGCAIAGTPPKLYCWGVGNALKPGVVAGSTVPVGAVAAGDGFTCAADRPVATAPYRLICKGTNSSGQMGNGTTLDPSSWVVVSQLDEWVYDGTNPYFPWRLQRIPFVLDHTVAGPEGAVGPVIAAGESHACAVVNVEWSASAPSVYPVSGRQVACWGDNTFGQVANRMLAPQTVSTPYVSPDAELGGDPSSVQLALGARHSCMASPGGVTCWGASDRGQVLTGTLPLDYGETAVKVAAGGAHTCAITSTGRVVCWGDNTRGQVGNGTTSASPASPAMIAMPFGAPSTFVDIAAGANHTCAVTSTDEVWCWGANDRGQVGNGVAGGTVPQPTRVGVRFVRAHVENMFAAGSPPAGLRWVGFEELLTAGGEAPIPPDFPGFRDGASAPRAMTVEVNGAAPEDVLVWGYDLWSGQLLYRVGFGQPSESTHQWTELEVGTTLRPGADGTLLTIADVDGDGKRDLIYIAVDDIDAQAVRWRIGTNLHAPTEADPLLVSSWSATRELRGARPVHPVYVPLAPLMNASAATVGFAARMFLPTTVPSGTFHAHARLVWMARGRTDDPELASAVPGGATSNVPTVLATYPDRFSLTGFEATEYDGVETAVFSPDVADEETRTADASLAGLLLSETWLNGEDNLSSQALMDETGLTLEHLVLTSAHEDEAIVSSQRLVDQLLEAVPSGDRVPVLFAVERELRSASLDDVGFVSGAGGTLSADLARTPMLTLRTFAANFYDTSGPEPVLVETGLLDWLDEHVADPAMRERVATMLVAWDVGETTIAAVDGAVVPRMGSDDATVQQLETVMQSSGWSFTDFLPALDLMDGLVSIRQYAGNVAPAVRRAATWPGPSSSIQRAGALLRAKSSIATAGAAGLAKKSADVAASVRTFKKVADWVEKAGTLVDLAVIGLTFYAAWKAYGGNAGLARAIGGMLFDLAVLGLELAFTSAVSAGLITLGVASGPAGWIATGIVLVITAILWVIDWQLDLGWSDWLKNQILPVFGSNHELVASNLRFENLRSIVEDYDGNGLDPGDAIGLRADAYTAEYSLGRIDPGGLFGDTGTQLRDLWWTAIGVGMRAQVGASDDARSVASTEAPWWTGGTAGSLPPGRRTVQAFAVPDGPDTDFAVTYDLQTRARAAVLECVIFSGCSHTNPAGREAWTELATLHYDVLPETLSGFLGWTSVVTRLDQDGDGLPAASDPYDNDADHDADGIPDGLESRLFATIATRDTDNDGLLDGWRDGDSDGDGLLDGLEIALGTDPLKSDTDGDDGHTVTPVALTDQQEIAGWNIAFTFKGHEIQAHVTSDPTVLDTDGDGMTDSREKELGLNPRSMDTNGDDFPDGEDDDADGISDSIENAAPNGGDGNGDGTKDADQANVTSLPDAVDGSFVTVAAPAGTSLGGVETTAAPEGTPARIRVPHGLVGFEVDPAVAGGSVVVKLYLPYDSLLRTFWKYGPTADNHADHWYRFDYDRTTGAEVARDPLTIGTTQVTVVTLHLVDGARGDGDLAANGHIVDPGALGQWLNDPPVASNDTATTGEDESVVIPVLANDNDPNGDALVVEEVDTTGTAGAVAQHADGTVTYDPSGRFDDLRPGESVIDSFGYTISDGYAGTASAIVYVTVTGVDDAPTWISTPDGSAQYSDSIAPITVTARDVDSDAIALAAAGLPAGLTIGPASCAAWASGAECSAQLAGFVSAPAGEYDVTLTASDGARSIDSTITVSVTLEDATVRFPGGNRVAVKVDANGGTSGPFELTARVTEAVPDTALGSPAAGNPGLAEVEMQLVPVGAGGPLVPAGACRTRLTGTGYDAQTTVTCPFDDVPVNTYAVETLVEGDRYRGEGSDVLVVYDPSLGYTAGGGTFSWPGSNEVVTFGYTMTYDKKGTSPRGSFLLVRHTTTGDYAVRSNALFGLALGDAVASFSGKATYLEPGWDTRVGNHVFMVYVEDDTAGDRFWIEVRDKSMVPIPAMSMPMPGPDNAVVIGSGDIFAPATR